MFVIKKTMNIISGVATIDETTHLRAQTNYYFVVGYNNKPLY